MPRRTMTPRPRKPFSYSSLLVAMALVFAMIGILIAFPKVKDVMATVASGALAMVAVMTLPRKPSA